MKQRTDTKNDVKRIKSDNFTRTNREKSNIAKNEWFDGTIVISYFGGSNNICADCTLQHNLNMIFNKNKYIEYP